MTRIVDVADGLTRWCGWLDEGPAAWPEWATLRELALGGSYELVRPSHTGWTFLVGADARGLPLCVRLEEEQPPARLPPLCPRALLDLKRERDPLQAGGILGALGDTPLGPDSEPHLLGYLDPGEVRFPARPLYPLQTDRSGAHVFWDEEGQVWAFDVEARGFALVGGLEPFLRYCLAQLLAGARWDEAYARGEGLTAFGLPRHGHAGSRQLRPGDRG